jgi:hypothetical protein
MSTLIITRRRAKPQKPYKALSRGGWPPSRSSLSPCSPKDQLPIHFPSLVNFIEGSKSTDCCYWPKPDPAGHEQGILRRDTSHPRTTVDPYRAISKLFSPGTLQKCWARCDWYCRCLNSRALTDGPLKSPLLLRWDWPTWPRSKIGDCKPCHQTMSIQTPS